MCIRWFVGAFAAARERPPPPDAMESVSSASPFGNSIAHVPAQVAHPCSARIVGSDLAVGQIVASNSLSLSVSNRDDDSPQKTPTDTKEVSKY